MKAHAKRARKQKKIRVVSRSRGNGAGDGNLSQRARRARRRFFFSGRGFGEDSSPQRSKARKDFGGGEFTRIKRKSTDGNGFFAGERLRQRREENFRERRFAGASAAAGSLTRRRGGRGELGINRPVKDGTGQGRTDGGSTEKLPSRGALRACGPAPPYQGGQLQIVFPGSRKRPSVLTRESFQSRS